MLIFSPRSRSCSKKRLTATAGFTLVELLVVTAIIFIITATVLLRQNQFNSTTLLRSLGYSVALTVRQAQTYGTAVREAEGSTASGYGVYVSSGTPTAYVLFADLNGNGQYDPTLLPTSETIKTYKIGNGSGADYSIYDFCVTHVNGTSCARAASITNMTIFFRRPNPDACISTSTLPTVCAPGSAASYQGAYIQVIAGTDPTKTRKVTVTTTGQISVGAVGQ